MSNISDMYTHFIVSIGKYLAMKSIIDILATDWVNTTYAEISQIEALVNFILGDLPVGSIGGKALDNLLRERSGVNIELVKNHCALCVIFTFISKDPDKLSIRERGVLVPFANP